jgi:ribulose-phosphate 3-epimerase
MTRNPATPFEAVAPFLSTIDLLLIMTVHPGFGGQAFRPEMMEKVKRAKAWRDTNGGKLDIEIDGGINADTLPRCLEAGADVFVVGTGIFHADDPAAAAKAFRALMEPEQGSEGGA